MRLEEKTAVITGGGRGIGAAIALAFAREGADVSVVSRTRPELEQTADEIRAIGRRSLPIVADVSAWQDMQRMAELVEETFGRLDILVNCAAVQGPIGPTVDCDPQEWVDAILINLAGTFLSCRAALPMMIRQGSGKIINFSGGGATSPRPRFSSYSSSKTAVVRLTETLAQEVADFNIQVNAIAPGAVNTRMLHEVLAAGDAAGDKALDGARRQLATGGDDIARAAALAVFLASGESDGLSGRLISAIWDRWEEFPDRLQEISMSDLYTLRRVTP
ncbi:MAG: SDR family oxidoreductase [Dehalococcoidia bacterium]